VIRVFVYGSLKRAGLHHAEMRDAELEREATTEPGFRLVMQGSYPALARGGSGVVHGELYSVSATLLAALDRFEDVPRLYRRQHIRLDDGSHAEAYVIDEEIAATCPEVPSGSWPA
jgi:gamma-glutamylaminecyclotransferase